MNTDELGSAYQEHLAGLYPERVLALHQMAGAAEVDERHRIFDVIRRFLDMCRIMNKTWPTSTRFLTSCLGDEILECVFAGIIHQSASHELKSAIRQASIELLAAQTESVFFEVFKYEELITKSGKMMCLYEATRQVDGYEIVLICNSDMHNLFSSLDFYRKTHAPTSFFRTLQIPKRLTYVLKEI